MAGAEGFEPPLAVLETAGLPLNLCPYITTRGTPSVALAAGLLNLLVRVMLAAERAEFREFQAFRRGFLVLHGGVVLALTLATLQCNLFSCHLPSPHSTLCRTPAPEAPWPPRSGL